MAIAKLRQAIQKTFDRAYAKQPCVPLPDQTIKADETAKPADALAILGTWCVTSVAMNPADLRKALIARQARPAPDEIFTDESGYPMLTGRVPDLDIAATEAYLTKAGTGERRDTDAALTGEQHSETISGFIHLARAGDGRWRDVLIRTLALLGRLVDELETDWPLASQEQAWIPERLMDNPTVLHDEFQVKLQVQLLIPADFRTAELQVIRAYLLERLAALPQCGEFLNIDLLPASDSCAASALNGLTKSLNDRHPHAVLLLALASPLCRSVIDASRSQQELWDAKSPNGLIPGEAAFGILLQNAVRPASVGMQATNMEAAGCINGFVCMRRDTSADSELDPSHACLSGAIQQVLESTGLGIDNIKSIVSDADHRQTRIMELAGARMESLPLLDAIEDCLPLGEACGNLGAASLIGAIVTASAQAACSAHPVMALSLSHPFERIAAILLPSLPSLAESHPANPSSSAGYLRTDSGKLSEKITMGREGAFS